MDLLRVDNDWLLAEYWLKADVVGLLTQLGVFASTWRGGPLLVAWMTAPGRVARIA